MVISLHVWSVVSSLRLASSRKMLTNWIKLSGGHQDDFGLEHRTSREGLRQLGWVNLKKRPSVNLVAVYNHLIRR